jgi:hypothetical protein
VDVATIVLFDAVALPQMVSQAKAGSTAFDLLTRSAPPDRWSCLRPTPSRSRRALETYPVWIGRTGDGSVAAYMVDMLLLAAAPS